MCYISCPIKVKLEKLHGFSETFCVRPQSDSICFMTLWHFSCPIKVKLEKLHGFGETFCVRPQSDSICFTTLWHFLCPTRIGLEMFHFALTQVNLTNRWRGLYPYFCQIAFQLQWVCWHKTYPTGDILEILTVLHIQSNLGQTQNDSQAWLCYNYCLIKVGLPKKWRHKKPVRHFSDMNCDT